MSTHKFANTADNWFDHYSTFKLCFLSVHAKRSHFEANDQQKNNITTKRFSMIYDAEKIEMKNARNVMCNILRDEARKRKFAYGLWMGRRARDVRRQLQCTVPDLMWFRNRNCVEIRSLLIVGSVKFPMRNVYSANCVSRSGFDSRLFELTQTFHTKALMIWTNFWAYTTSRVLHKTARA